MSDRSKIEWTDATWNPVRGCTRVSAGCGGPGDKGGCYAEQIAARFSDPGQPFHGFVERTAKGGRWTGKVALVEAMLWKPLEWKRPRKIFVNSMSDLFHEKLPDEAIDKVFAVMALCPQHTFQVLTKRPARMRAYLNDGDVNCRIAYASVDAKLPDELVRCPSIPLRNVWLGTSVEDQATADERIPSLLGTPAAIRFVSYEPALGQVDFKRIDLGTADVSWCIDPTIKKATFLLDALHGAPRTGIPGVDWIICGGESGPNARPMHPEWARAVRQQCKGAGVPFFMKQLSGERGRAIKDITQFPEDLRVRELPNVT